MKKILKLSGNMITIPLNAIGEAEVQESDEPIIKNAVRCGICQAAADRYENRFQCQTNPSHVGDLNVGIFTNLAHPAAEEKAKFGEPWHVGTNPGGPEQQPAFPCVHDNSGLPHGEDIAAQVMGTSEQCIDRANRIVSCVNALAGIADPVAWVKAHRELAEAVNPILETVRIYANRIDRFDKLKMATLACEAAEGRESEPAIEAVNAAMYAAHCIKCSELIIGESVIIYGIPGCICTYHPQCAPQPEPQFHIPPELLEAHREWVRAFVKHQTMPFPPADQAGAVLEAVSWQNVLASNKSQPMNNDTPTTETDALVDYYERNARHPTIDTVKTIQLCARLERQRDIAVEALNRVYQQEIGKVGIQYALLRIAELKEGGSK